MLEVRKSMLYLAFKVLRAKAAYGTKTPSEGEVLTAALPSWFPYRGLILEIPMVAPTPNRYSFGVDNKFRVCCAILWADEDKSFRRLPQGGVAEWMVEEN